MSNKRSRNSDETITTTSTSRSPTPSASPSRTPTLKAQRLAPNYNGHGHGHGHGGSPPLLCTLPPTCDPPRNVPTALRDANDLERHYAMYHAHVCTDRSCGAVFPDERLLELVRILEFFSRVFELCILILLTIESHILLLSSEILFWLRIVVSSISQNAMIRLQWSERNAERK